jgi:hypothetical protein
LVEEVLVLVVEPGSGRGHPALRNKGTKQKCGSCLPIIESVLGHGTAAVEHHAIASFDLLEQLPKRVGIRRHSPRQRNRVVLGACDGVALPRW